MSDDIKYSFTCTIKGDTAKAGQPGNEIKGTCIGHVCH